MVRNSLANSILLSTYSVFFAIGNLNLVYHVSYCMKPLSIFIRLISNVRYKHTISLVTTTLGKCNAKDDQCCVVSGVSVFGGSRIGGSRDTQDKLYFKHSGKRVNCS